jgi:hypothetical protein
VSAAVRAGAVLDALATDRVLPFLNQSYAPYVVSGLLEAVQASGLKTLGFNPQQADGTTITALLTHPLVRDREIHVIATAVLTPRHVHDLCDKGVKHIFYAGPIGQITQRELSRCDLFVPIAPEPGAIVTISRWLDDHRLPKVIKTYLADSGDHPRPLNPDELRQIVDQNQGCTFIHFGGVRSDNLQSYRDSGVLALGVSKLIPERVTGDGASILEQVRRFILK